MHPFNALALRERADVLWNTGDFIAVCRKRLPYVQFFAMDGFFVELQFDPQQVSMLGLTAFASGEKYDRMVEAMDLRQLPGE